MLEIVIRASARCLLCGNEVVGLDGGLLSYCSCGELAVDGPSSGRIVGNPANYENTSILGSDGFTVAMIDLGAAADDFPPADGELAESPVLSHWRLARRGDGQPCLIGVCVGHPRLPDGYVTTRPLIAIAVDDGWARSEGRLYRLGERDPDAPLIPPQPLEFRPSDEMTETEALDLIADIGTDE